MTESEIRRLLTQTIETEPENYSKVLELSSMLSRFDRKNVRFSVDAGVIDRLGRELVGKKETAVSELVKNAYDADAKKVDLTFSDSDYEGGTLEISDDGIGMSREELIDGFMKISSTDKVHNPKSPKYKRNRAGRKGIGRFAVQRLGNRLAIISRKEGSPTAVKVTIDWSLYKGDQDLLTINNQIEEFESDRAFGTTLTIEGLRDKWTIASIERVFRYISALIQPFPLSKERIKQEKERSSKTLDPGFKASLFKKDGSETIAIADEQSMIFDYSVAVFEGIVDDHGHSLLSIKSKRFEIDEMIQLGAEKDKFELGYGHLRNVSFKAYYFLYTSDYIPTQQLSKIRELSHTAGGIRLYRNGFRVLPYGEFGDDWIELDESERKRTLLARHANNNFFGFVEVYDPEGEKFQETSSREGLLDTSSFEELKDWVYRSIITGVIRIGHARDIKVTSGQKNWQGKADKPVRKLKALKEELEKEAEAVKTDSYTEKTKEEITDRLIDQNEKIRRTVDTIDEVIAEQELEDSLQFKETGILRVLASLGLSIGIFTHEIRHYLAAINASTKLLSKKYKEDNEYQNKIAGLLDNVRTLRTYTSYFDKAISENITRELVPQEVPLVVSQFFKVVSLDSGLNQVEIQQTEINGADLFTVPMHSSEWATILFNLYTNSLKAIKRAKTDNGKVWLRIGKENRRVYLEFLDNGDGIPEVNRDRIFEPFFTTSTSAGHFADEQDEILGTGLGLKIVKDIINAYDGSIEVVDAPSDYSTNIRIELPEATEKDLENT